MKTNTRACLPVLIFAILLAAAISGAADQPAAVAAPETAAGWIVANSAAVFGILLALSEFMALIPGIKGNGILDSIIKALKSLSGKNASPP